MVDAQTLPSHTGRQPNAPGQSQLAQLGSFREQERETNFRALSRSAENLGAATTFGQPGLHVVQAVAAWRNVFQPESAAIVLNGQAHERIFQSKLEPDLRRAGVF